MSPLIIIAISVIAGAILSVLVDWLLKQSLPEKPETKHRIVGFVVAFILVFVVATALTSQSNDAVVSSPTMTADSPAPNASPTQPIATNFPIPMETPSPSPTLSLGEAHPFKVGDYFIYEVVLDSEPYGEERYEITGVDSIEGYQTWVIAYTLGNMSASLKESIREHYGTLWIDQNSGKYIRLENHFIYAKERAYLDLQIIELTAITTYNIDQNTVETNSSRIDTLGKEHNSSRSYPWFSPIFRITRDVELGEWYPSKLSDKGPKVIKAETVSLASGRYDCWVIKSYWAEDLLEIYTLYFFEKKTGMLVKKEDWEINSGTWKLVGEHSLVSYKFDE